MYRLVLIALICGACSPEPPKPAPAVSEAAKLRLHAMRWRVRDGGTVPCVLLGDSITDLWSDVPELSASYFRPGTLNCGVGSLFVGGVRWQIDNGVLDGYQARNVVLLIGVNDIAAGRKPEEVAADIRELLATIKAKQPTANVVHLAILPAEGHREAIEATNALMPDAIDVGGKLLVDGGIDRSIMVDGLHLSPKGYEILGEQIAGHLK
jgi:lysophospholipase L1-like esterase